MKDKTIKKLIALLQCFHSWLLIKTGEHKILLIKCKMFTVKVKYRAFLFDPPINIEINISKYGE